MPLGQVAKCIHCKIFGSEDELQLNRTLWEYECRNRVLCKERQDNPEVIKDRIRANNKRKKKKNEMY